jgi:hypothetical protein
LVTWFDTLLLLCCWLPPTSNLRIMYTRILSLLQLLLLNVLLLASAFSFLLMLAPCSITISTSTWFSSHLVSACAPANFASFYPYFSYIMWLEGWCIVFTPHKHSISVFLSYYVAWRSMLSLHPARRKYPSCDQTAIRCCGIWRATPQVVPFLGSTECGGPLSCCLIPMLRQYYVAWTLLLLPMFSGTVRVRCVYPTHSPDSGVERRTILSENFCLDACLGPLKNLRMI